MGPCFTVEGAYYVLCTLGVLILIGIVFIWRGKK